MSTEPAHINHYYDTARITRLIKEGHHRNTIGGLWEELGQMQLDYLKTRGLQPQMRFLDIGCGCLRGGVHFVRYLNAGHYYGSDLSQDLLDVGYDVELAGLGLTEKLPRNNLLCSGDFDFSSLGQSFDMAFAMSVFTHLTQNHLRLCLDRLADVMTPGGVFFMTLFHCPDSHPWRDPLTHTPGNIVTQPDRDPFHYRRSHLEQAMDGLPWRLGPIEDWNHPRGQKICGITRL